MSHTDLEVKFRDTFTTVGTTIEPVLGTPFISYVSGVSQGDNANDRIGDRLKVLSFTMKLLYLVPTNGGPAIMRNQLILDRQPNGALATALQLLQQGGAQQPLLEPLNMSRRNRFQILKTWDVNIDPATHSLKTKTVRVAKKFTAQYSAVGSGIAATQTNALLWVAWGFDGTVGNNVRMSFYQRLRYVG